MTATAGGVYRVGELSVRGRRGEAVAKNDDSRSFVEGDQQRIDAPVHLGVVRKDNDASRPSSSQGTHNARATRCRQFRGFVEHRKPGELPPGEEGFHETGTVFGDEVVNDHGSDSRLGMVLREGGSGPFCGGAPSDCGDAHDGQRALHDPEPTGGATGYFALFAALPLAEALTEVRLPLAVRRASAFGPPGTQPA